MMVASYYAYGRGKSINALDCERNGVFPLTRAIDYIYRQVNGYYKITKKQIREWLLKTGSSEKHHVGKYAVLCDYYDTSVIIESLFDCMHGIYEFDDQTDPIFFNNFLDKFEKNIFPG